MDAGPKEQSVKEEVSIPSVTALPPVPHLVELELVVET
jgi:hypothetical protein